MEEARHPGRYYCGGCQTWKRLAAFSRKAVIRGYCYGCCIRVERQTSVITRRLAALAVAS